MAINFPDSPSVGDVFRDFDTGYKFEWDGYVWKSYADGSAANMRVLDDISASFNGSTQTFQLRENGSLYYPVSAQQLRIVLGGVVQAPNTDYTISGANITFSTAPLSGLTFSAVTLTPGLPLNSIPDSSVTPIKLSSGGPSWNTGGDLSIAGITTLTVSDTPTIPTNETLSFELTSNTNLRIYARGTDGVVRTANITLS